MKRNLVVKGSFTSDPVYVGGEQCTAMQMTTYPV